MMNTKKEFELTESPVLIKELFNFLIKDYGFILIEDVSSNAGVLIVYQGKKSKVGISFDYRDNFFSVDLVRGKHTQYPSDIEYGLNIKPLSELVKKNIPNYNVDKMQVTNSKYFDLLKENAEMLKKYGDKVLKGEEWF